MYDNPTPTRASTGRASVPLGRRAVSALLRTKRNKPANTALADAIEAHITENPVGLPSSERWI